MLCGRPRNTCRPQCELGASIVGADTIGVLTLERQIALHQLLDPKDLIICTIASDNAPGRGNQGVFWISTLNAVRYVCHVFYMLHPDRTSVVRNDTESAERKSFRQPRGGLALPHLFHKVKPPKQPPIQSHLPTHHTFPPTTS